MKCQSNSSNSSDGYGTVSDFGGHDSKDGISFGPYGVYDYAEQFRAPAASTAATGLSSVCFLGAAGMCLFSVVSHSTRSI
ncbi:hypothetical protein GQ43DRAFT_79932 [Delitschia confertaspora ATCC 74209]|uniref:Uncharacterized protein n=1 Tax=Delitschia confertaspora ATCC 74209 TaxID=1513339 RepID=A0A9P4JNW6_9PLEO|nr:hypothetical protein GQ43DRAFT_79932 [Delitschia confertaspora ATCC 74209]